MTVRERNILSPLEEIAEFCRRHPIAKLSLFGSVLRDDFRDASDVDFLVEFEPGAKVTYFYLAQLEIDLEEIVGRKVDVRLAGELDKRFRDEVVRSAEEIYAANISH